MHTLVTNLQMLLIVLPPVVMLLSITPTKSVHEVIWITLYAFLYRRIGILSFRLLEIRVWADYSPPIRHLFSNQLTNLRVTPWWINQKYEEILAQKAMNDASQQRRNLHQSRSDNHAITGMNITSQWWNNWFQTWFWPIWNPGHNRDYTLVSVHIKVFCH